MDGLARKMRIESVLLGAVIQAFRGEFLIARVGRGRVPWSGEKDRDAVRDEIVGEALNFPPVPLDAVFVPAEELVHVLAEHVPEETFGLRAGVRGADGFHRSPAAPVLEAEDVAGALLKAGAGERGRGGDVAADKLFVRGVVDQRDFLEVRQQQPGDRIEAQISVGGDGVLFGV